MGLKISGKTVQALAVDLSKAVIPVIKKAGFYVKPLIQVIKKHPVEVTACVVGTGLFADDLHQRHQNNVLKKNMEDRDRKTKEALKKHEVEMQALKVEADKAQNLVNINKQLCEMIKAQKEETDDAEKENTDRTAD